MQPQRSARTHGRARALKALRDQGILTPAYTLNGPGAALFVDVASSAGAEHVGAERLHHDACAGCAARGVL